MEPGLHPCGLSIRASFSRVNISMELCRLLQNPRDFTFCTFTLHAAVLRAPPELIIVPRVLPRIEPTRSASLPFKMGHATSFGGKMSPAMSAGGFPAPHGNLPMKKEQWKAIIDAFLPHRAIMNRARKVKCQSTFLAYKHGKHKLELEMRSAVAAPYSRPRSFSLFSTHFARSRLSLAILYSCNTAQLARIAGLLQASPEVASHPLLMVGVFAELQLDRMREVVTEVQGDGARNRRSAQRVWAARTVIFRHFHYRLNQGIVAAKEAEEELRAVKAQLNDLTDGMDERLEEWKGWPSRYAGMDPGIVMGKRHGSHLGFQEIQVQTQRDLCRV
jgi:hypothetical protein